jgi:hypothetical protein
MLYDRMITKTKNYYPEPSVSTHPNSKVQPSINLATSTNYDNLNCLIVNLSIFNCFYVSESKFLFLNNQGNKHCPFSSI